MSSVSGVCRLPEPKITQQLKCHFSLVVSVLGGVALSSCAVLGARKRRECLKSNHNDDDFTMSELASVFWLASRSSQSWWL